MKKFEIYKHPTLGTEAVKVGFSWPAFFFNWMWAFVYRLWGYGLGMLAVSLFLIPFARIFFLEGNNRGASLMIILELCFLFLFGEKGNGWKKETMKKNSYSLQKTVQAKTAEEAISSIGKKK